MHHLDWRRGAISSLIVTFAAAGCSPSQSGPITVGNTHEVRNWDREPEADFAIDKVLGQWELTIIESGEISVSSPNEQPPLLEVLRDRCRFTCWDEDEPFQVDFLLSVNLERSPKEFELSCPGDSIRGAFKLLADGRLAIALTMDLDADPLPFPSKVPSSMNPREPHVVILVLKRIEQRR